MTQVTKFFLSYSRADATRVLRIAARIRESGANIWLDQLDIKPGQLWDSAVQEALRSCTGLVAFLSKNSVGSDNFLDEVAYAIDHKRKIVPVLLEHCEKPYRLTRHQQIDLVEDEDAGIELLLRALGDKKYGEASAHVDSLPPPNRSNASRRLLAFRTTLRASLVCAWVGSLALAVTVAYGTGILKSAEIREVAYWVTLVALIVGGIATVLLGAVSFKRRFTLGVLQGWVWPVVLTIGELTILLGAGRVIANVPASELESMFVMVLLGAIGPGLLTIGAVVTSRSFD